MRVLYSPLSPLAVVGTLLGLSVISPPEVQQNAPDGSLSTPTSHLVLVVDGEAIKLEDAGGHAMRFVANNKKERHQPAAGTVDARTKWDKSNLQQEFVLPGGIRLKRAYTVSPDSKQLVVTARLTEREEGDPRPAIRTVYDRDEVR